MVSTRAHNYDQVPEEQPLDSVDQDPVTEWEEDNQSPALRLCMLLLGLNAGLTILTYLLVTTSGIGWQ